MIIKNQTEADYNAMEGLRSSIISIIDRKTLAHAKAKLDDFTESEKGEFVIGAACHDMILRPSIFAKKWGCLPEDYDGRTTKGKEIKSELSKKYGANLLKQGEMHQLHEIRKSLESNRLAKTLLDNVTETELTLKWYEDRIPCKARIDAVAEINGKTILIDLKTSRSADKHDFERSCVSYGYIIQSAHYLAGAKACGLIDADNNNFLHVVIEKEAPYLCAVYCLDDASLELGEKRRRLAIDNFRKASEAGIWTGYSEMIETIAAPHWYFEQNSDLADGI